MSISDLTVNQWLLGIIGAFCMGLGKGGLPGLGNIAIWFYATAFGAKPSVGILLPVLICGDMVATIAYRRHADFKQVWRLMPWSMVGVVIGTLLFGWIPAEIFAAVIGGLLLAMTGLHFFRQWLMRKHAEDHVDPVPHKLWFFGSVGTLGGIATMLANAAGPIASFYFMAIKLPKLSFIGTTAWYFMLINVFKLPFQAAVNNLNLSSLKISLCFGAFAVAGGFIAPHIVKYIPQRAYNTVIWSLIIIASVSLIVG
ncbi:MAG: sulfite exporter TauE/SafE family protein [Verrucomicrobiota bacterium JB024]|nr:sulfite exporter TauE/SafE family protein [Verrucomicrobiota bacterium JB024]